MVEGSPYLFAVPDASANPSLAPPMVENASEIRADGYWAGLKP